MAKPLPKVRGEYVNILALTPNLKWQHPEGEPEGVHEAFLNKHEDGSYTHIIRIEPGTEFREPVSHEFFEEAYYIQGEMLNTKTKRTIKAGSYVFHEPHEEHGPFKCLKTCLILEFRYYK
ncbi:MAG TPA: cupin domain-containing protein [Nitrososphaerales archaeon]|nr:cupin domain-containing protein [Nitrososphaerales archaeon]